MNSNVISVDTKVEIELFDSTGDKIGTFYTGMFSEILGEMEVVVSFPAGQGPLPSVFIRCERVSAVFHHMLHGQLKFKGDITFKEQNGYGTKLHIKIDDDFKEIQKREYFRPICNAKAEYRLLKKYGGLVFNESSFKSARTRNISYTGACILTEKSEEIRLNDLIDLVVWLKQNTSVLLHCKVIRVGEFEAKDSKHYDIGLAIESIEEKDEPAFIEFLTRSSMVSSLYWGESPFNY